MSTRKYDETVKVLMLGESGVGKTSLLARFSGEKWSINYLPTLGVEFKQKTVAINEKQTLIQVWDTAGQEKFRTITPNYYKKVDAAVMVFDITDEESFNSIDFWMKNLEDRDTDLRIILVGNKQDMEEKRVVSKEVAEELAARHKIKYLETSAKNKYNVVETFVSVASDVLEYKKTLSNQSENISMKNTAVEPNDVNISTQTKREPPKSLKQDNNKCLGKCWK